MFYADTVNVFDEKVAQQLKYVAVSRAKEDVYIVTSNNINEPVIENRDIQIEQKESNNKPINKISRATTNQESKQGNSFLSRFSTFDRNAMNEMNNEGKLIADFCKGKTV